MNNNGAWISIGDFNFVLSTDEVSSIENWTLHRSSTFQDWIFNKALLTWVYLVQSLLGLESYKLILLRVLDWIGHYVTLIGSVYF